MVTLVTFGDSVLDCGVYNEHGITPGELIVRNDDDLFPEFRGRDLASLGSARLEHRAQDGATVGWLAEQARGLHVRGPAIALLSVGGNDLLQALARGRAPDLASYQAGLEQFLDRLAVRRVLLASVYDPSFGDDTRNDLGFDPALARAAHRRTNAVIQKVASRFGTLVDLHAHFLTGDSSWYSRVIEPSLKGASEVRRAFLDPVLTWARQVNEGPV